MNRPFVVLRNIDDLETISSYIRIRIKEVEHLSVAYLKLLQDPVNKVAVRLDSPEITRDSCARSLVGFDCEFIEIRYSGDGLPASAFLTEATKRRCDAIVVVGAERKPYSSVSLAASLVDESSIPVVVMKS